MFTNIPLAQNTPLRTEHRRRTTRPSYRLERIRLQVEGRLLTLTALAPFMAIVLVSLALAGGHALAAHADNIATGSIACAVCPTLPQPPSLEPPRLTDGGNAVQFQGQGFSSYGGIDLYVWQDGAVDSFAGTAHTTAHGSALTLDVPVVASKQGQYCGHPDDIFVVAIDDNTHLSSGVRRFVGFPALGCYALKLSPVPTKPSLRATLNAAKGTIHVWGRHYTPDTSVALYSFQDDMPMFPRTLTAKGTRVATTLSTGHLGCSAMQWETFALDQTANVASPLLTVADPCDVPK